MQKVVGSNPIIRSLETPATAGVFVFQRLEHVGVRGVSFRVSAHCCPINTADKGVHLRAGIRQSAPIRHLETVGCRSRSIPGRFGPYE